MTKAAAEFETARAALIAAGFTNSQALELLTKRYELRDRFAMAALQGTLASDPENYRFDNAALRSAWTYLQADAMLAARMDTDTGDER